MGCENGKLLFREPLGPPLEKGVRGIFNSGSCPVFDRGRGFRAGDGPDCPSSHWVAPLRFAPFHAPRGRENDADLCHHDKWPVVCSCGSSHDRRRPHTSIATDGDGRMIIRPYEDG